MDILRTLAEWLQSLWPFRIVHEWEHGLLLKFGSFWRPLTPGLKVCLPFFTEIISISKVLRVVQTPLHTTMLKDGAMLTYQANLYISVVDARKAYFTVENWLETVVEMAAGTLNEFLPEVERDRFDAARGKRDRLRAEAVELLNEKTMLYGVAVHELEFIEFGIGIAVYRVLGEPMTILPGAKHGS